MKKTKLLTSLVALALVACLGACDININVSGDSSSDTSDTETSESDEDTYTSGSNDDGEGGSPDADPNEPYALAILESFTDVGVDSLTTEWDAIYAKVDNASAGTSDEAYLTSQNDLLYGYVYSVDQDYQTKTDYYFVDGEEWEHEIDEEYDLETYNRRGNSATYVSYFEGSYTFDFSEVFDKAEELLDVEDEKSASLKDVNYELSQDEETLFYTLKVYEEDGLTYTYVTSSDYIILALGYVNTDEDEGKEYYAECSSYEEVEKKVLNLEPALWEYADASSEGLEFKPIYDENQTDVAVAYYVSSYDMSLTQKAVAIPSEYEGLPVTSIGNPEGSSNSNAVFKGATTSVNNLRTVIIPDSVTTIAAYAFYYCCGLVTLSIPSSVTTIGKYAFDYCYGLKSIEIEEGGLEEIASYAFQYCDSLKTLEIPDTVTTIGDHAFYYCYSLYSMEIPSSVTSLGANVFATCPGLVSAKLPGSIGSVPSSAFSADYALKDVELGEGITSIEGSAFATCYSLSEISLPSGFESLAATSFSGYGFKDIFIPKSLTTLAYNAFNYTYGLTIYYEGSEEEWNSIEISSGSSNYLNNATFYYNCEELGDTAGEEYVTNLEDFTFVINDDEASYRVTKYSMTATTPNIEIPATYNNLPVTAVGSPTASASSGGSLIPGVSSSANYVRRIRLPEGIETIYPYALGTAYALQEINIPSTVTSIGKNAFEKDYGLEEVNFAEGCGITEILANTFDYCSSLRSIEIPSKVTSIGDKAFEYCGSLTSVEIPEGVESIEASCFYFCYTLRRISIPSTVTYLGASMFNYVYALNEVKIADDMDAEWNTATFSGCYSLASVNLPSKLKALPNSTFNYCYSLESIVIPASLESVGDTCFNSNCCMTEIYYCGDEEGWEQVSVSSTSNAIFQSLPVYYYAATRPETEGNYWHYVNGQAVAYSY